MWIQSTLMPQTSWVEIRDILGPYLSPFHLNDILQTLKEFKEITCTIIHLFSVEHVCAVIEGTLVDDAIPLFSLLKLMLRRTLNVQFLISHNFYRLIDA